MECFGAIPGIVDIVWGPISNRFEYHRSLEDNMKILERKLEELNSRKSDKESQINVELRSGKIIKDEVELWLRTVEKINNEKLDDLEQELRKRKYLSRARLSKRAVKMIEEVKQVFEKGSFSYGLMVDVPRGEMFPTTAVVGETTAKRKEEIWTSLISDDDVRKIGLYGLGGSGKTTITKHIHNRILGNKHIFDNVFWITVSKAKDIIRLQSDIAKVLDVDISKHEDESTRATMLYNELQTKRRYVLIFDDMWEAFALEDVGIPEPTKENGCKLILTTRLLDVCHKWSCKCIKMELLSEEEAWNLFMDKVGQDVIMTSDLEETAKQIAKECARLPLAIVTVGTSMKGVTDEREWKNALKELRNSTKGLNEMEKVIERLKYSYTQLKDERLQHCLLFCGLYPEDYEIEREELIVYLMAEKIIKGAGSREDGLNEGHTILNKLENACLLEKHTGYGGLQYVKMHDVVRDMVLQIMGRGSLVEARVQLRHFPDKENWTEDLESVSLMDNDIEEIPTDASPRCSRLKTLLLLRNSSLTRIPDLFFAHMSALRVLDLSYTKIEILPDSVSLLRMLTALIATECGRLRYVPSLAPLLALELLDLHSTAIEEVPQGIEMLINLRDLTLISPHLKLFPTGILPKLSRLQRLAIHSGSNILKLKEDEVVVLSKLEILSCQFNDVDDFHTYIQLQQWRLLNRYFLEVGPIKPYMAVPSIYVKRVRLTRCNIGEGKDPLMLPNDIEELFIEKCNAVRSLSDILSFNNASVLPESSRSPYRTCATVPLLCLRRLVLKDLDNLQVLFREEGGVPSPTLPPGTFSCLTKLEIDNCGKIKQLFTPGLVSYLQNLEELSVYNCRTMEVIIAAEGEEEEGRGEGRNNQFVVKNLKSICLPKLRLLFLQNLPNLKSIICRRGVLAYDGIERIEEGGVPSPTLPPGTFSCLNTLVIYNCGKIKQLFTPGLVLNLQNLEELLVFNCGTMEVIIAAEGEEEEEEEEGRGEGRNNQSVVKNDAIITICLPKLRVLRLDNLPNLKSIISRRGVLACDGIEEIRVYDCWNLKRLPISLPVRNGQPSPPPSLKEIKIDDKEWWNSLEWDNPIVKDVLQSFVYL